MFLEIRDLLLLHALFCIIISWYYILFYPMHSATFIWYTLHVLLGTGLLSLLFYGNLLWNYPFQIHVPDIFCVFVFTPVDLSKVPFLWMSLQTDVLHFNEALFFNICELVSIFITGSTWKGASVRSWDPLTNGWEGTALFIILPAQPSSIFKWRNKWWVTSMRIMMN